MNKRSLPDTSYPLLSRWVYILVADNNSGKTGFQRYLVEYLCDKLFLRMPRDQAYPVTHPRAPRNFGVLATANRSYQEKKKENGSIEDYVMTKVPEADVTLLSSHVDKADVEEMLKHCKRRYANVAVVFLSNALSAGTQDISELPWQERLVLNNPPLRAGDSQDENIEKQLKELAVQFGDMLIAKTAIC